MNTTVSLSTAQSSKKALVLVALATALLLAAVAFFSASAVNAAKPADYGLTEGDVISAAGSDDPDVYIVNEHGFKRLFLNPAIFSFYGHLGGFSKVKTVTPAVRDAFPTSGLFRNCETNDPKVYGAEVTGEDIGTLHWVNTTGEQAVIDDPNFFQKVFCVNSQEFAFYPQGAAYTSVKQVPNYSRSQGTTTPVTSTAPTPTVSTEYVPTNGQVSVTANANPGGSVISGSAQTPVTNFKIANGTTSQVSVTSIKFVRSGVLSDSSISNAYLSLGNQIVAQYTGLSNGIMTFSNPLTIPANSAVNVTLRIDITSGLSTGNTLAFNLNSPADIVLSSGTVSGNFPIVGGVFTTTTVSNPSLASIDVAAANGNGYLSTATTVDAGSLGFRGSAIAVSVTNSPVRFTGARYTINGSLNMTDLANLKLRVDGVEVASIPRDGNGWVFFDMGANAPILNTGSHQIEVYVDVLGTPNRTFKFEILRPFDWTFVDTQYNTNITPGTPGGTATTVTVRQGTLTANLASDTPTGNIPRGGSSVTIAKFAIRAAGEPVKIKWLPFKLTQSGSAAAWTTGSNVDADVRNLSIIADDGTQLGTTINTPSSCTYGTPELTATTYICSVGSSTSNINYIIPANTTRVFSLRVDVQAAGDITTLKGSILAPSGTTGFTGSNVEGQISFQTSSTPGGTIDGSVLTIAASPFQGAQNSAFSSQTFVGGANQAKIGSFNLSASSAEKILVTSVTINTIASVNATSGTNILRIQNLNLKVKQTGSATGTEWNYNVPTVTGGTSYTFSSPGAPTEIPAGGTVDVDVYADILTNSVAFAYVAPVTLTGAVGVGKNTNTNQTLKTAAGTTISSGAPVSGQNITIAGTGTVTVTLDNSVPPAQQILLGSTGISLAKVRFQANNNEDIQIQDLKVVGSTSLSGPSTFKNLKLYDDAGVLVGTGTALTASTSGIYTSDFHFTTPLVIAKNQSKNYTLKGDVSSFTESTTSHNKTFNFRLTHASQVNAFGLASNLAATVSGISSPLTANTQTTLKTKINASMTLTATGTNSRQANHDIGTLNLTVPAGDFGAEFASLSFTVSGAALSGNAATVKLVDFDTNVEVASQTYTSSTATSKKLNLVNNLTSNTKTPFLITSGTTKKYKIRVDSSALSNPGTGTESISIQIANPTDFRYQSQGAGLSGTNHTTEILSLESTATPITTTITYE